MSNSIINLTLVTLAIGSGAWFMGDDVGRLEDAFARETRSSVQEMSGSFGEIPQDIAAAGDELVIICQNLSNRVMIEGRQLKQKIENRQWK